MAFKLLGWRLDLRAALGIFYCISFTVECGAGPLWFCNKFLILSFLHHINLWNVLASWSRRPWLRCHGSPHLAWCKGYLDICCLHRRRARRREATTNIFVTLWTVAVCHESLSAHGQDIHDPTHSVDSGQTSYVIILGTSPWTDWGPLLISWNSLVFDFINSSVFVA